MFTFSIDLESKFFKIGTTPDVWFNTVFLQHFYSTDSHNIWLNNADIDNQSFLNLLYSVPKNPLDNREVNAILRLGSSKFSYIQPIG